MFWGPRKRTRCSPARVDVVRVPVSHVTDGRTFEDFAVATVLGISLTIVLFQ